MDQALSFTWNITIVDADGDSFNWSVACENGDTSSANGASNGSKTLAISGLSVGTTYTVWVNATDSYNWTNETFDFTTRSQYVPAPPSGFSATAFNRSVIDLAWINNGSNNTVVEWYGSESWERGVGIELDNSTNTTYQHTGLSFGTQYFYQAWSYNSTDNVFSTTNSSANDTTSSNTGLILTSESPTNNSVTVELTLASVSVTMEDAEGDTFNWTIEVSTGDTNSANGASNGSKSCSVPYPLVPLQAYTWWVNATDGTNTTNASYTFTAKANIPPVFSNPNPANNSIDQSRAFTWNITMEVPDGSPPFEIYWNITCSNGQSNYGTDYNGSENIVLTGLAYSTTYTIWVNATNSLSTGGLERKYNSTNETFYFTTIANGVPVFTGETPTNNSVSVDINQATVNVTISDPDGHTFNWTIEVSNGDSDSANDASNGSKSCALTTPLAYNTVFTWWVNCTDSYNTTNASYTFTTRSVAEPELPTNIAASTVSDTSITLAWTKGVNVTHTYIERNTASIWAKGDGTLVCNITGSSKTDTGLIASTNYTYRFWSYNSTDNVFNSSNSSGYNWTKPQSPQNVTVVVNGSSLEFDWDNGTGCDTTLIVQKTSSYPVNETDGTVIYNSSLSNYTKPMFNNSDRFALFTYNSTSSFYSSGTNGEWGLLVIYVYKEDEAHVQIGNYTVFITNDDASETYQATNQNNPVELNVDDVPNGDDITIQISKSGYKTRSQIWDLEVNEQYNISFYLPSSSEGSPSDESGEDWYVNGSDSDNETFASHYIITVQDELGSPIESALVVIERYINTTDSYESVVIDYTDSSGQIEVDLIPDVVYYVSISHSSGDYQNSSSYWTPSEITYVEDAYKIFILDFIDVDPSYPDNPVECISILGEIGGTTLYVNFTDICDGTVSDIQIVVYEINMSTGSVTVFDTSNCSSGCDNYNTTFSDVNNSNSYTIVTFYNHTYWTNQSHTFTIDGTSKTTPSTTGSGINHTIALLFGTNPFGWHNIIMWLLLVIAFFYADERDSGKILMVAGVIMLFLNIFIGFNSLTQTLAGGAIPVLFIVVGLLVIWRDSQRKSG